MPNRRYELSHPSDEDIRVKEYIEQDAIQKMKNIKNIEAFKKIHIARRLEREILQKESSQKGTYECDALEAKLTPEMRKEITLKKAITFLDPGKQEKLCPKCIYNYQNMPDSQLKTVLTPKIIRNDYRNFQLYNRNMPTPSKED